jgi:prepilin-type N-terminal cleavage/methylation domain-containing protein
MKLRARTRPRKGFSLIEIMVALTMLSFVLMSLAKLATIVAVRGRGNDAGAKRFAVLQMEANKFGSMPYSYLSSFSTTDKSFTVGGFAYTRKLTITATGTNRYTVKIVVVPSLSGVAKDSVVFDRTAPSTTTALCTGC